MSIGEPKAEAPGDPIESNHLGVPDYVQEDKPSDLIGYAQDPTVTPGVIVTAEDPKEKHKREMELSKLKFSYLLVAACILGIIVLSAAESWWVPREGALPSAIETLKTVTLMVLGYVFGNSVVGGKDS